MRRQNSYGRVINHAYFSSFYAKCNKSFSLQLVFAYYPHKEMPVSEVPARLSKGGVWWIAIAFFLIAFALGLWMTSLPNTLNTQSLGWVLPLAFATGPLASLLSPLLFGAMADYRFSAQKLMGILSLVGAVFLGLGFYSLHAGWGPWYLSLIHI